MNSAARAALQEDKYGDDRWMCMHNNFLSDVKEKEPEVVIFGDYTVAFLPQTEVWERHFISLHCLNYGIAEDQTQHVLWRIENGELDNINPKVIVLSVGSNNYDYEAEQVVEGIQACVRAIKDRQPKSIIVVLKLLPCGQHPNPVREKRERINELMTVALKNEPNVQVINADPGFVHQDGTISRHDMFDFLHLTKQAYSQAFVPISELISQLLIEISGTLEPPPPADV